MFKNWGFLIPLALALFFLVMNWACWWANRRNRQRAIDRYHSQVPLVVQILACLAWLLAGSAPALPGWVFLAVALLDLALYSLLYLPIFLLRRAFKSRQEIDP